MACRHDQAAEDDRGSPAQPPIRDGATKQRRQINKRRIQAVDPGGLLLRDQQMLGHVEDQQGAHAEKRKLVPHFRQEKDRKTSGLSKPLQLRRQTLNFRRGFHLETPNARG